MAFCRHCGKEIAEASEACSYCGGVQRSRNAGAEVANGRVWMSITSTILGILCLLSLFDPSHWDRDTALGCGVLGVAGLLLGSISLARRVAGKRMAITGVIL